MMKQISVVCRDGFRVLHLCSLWYAVRKQPGYWSSSEGAIHKSLMPVPGRQVARTSEVT